MISIYYESYSVRTQIYPRMNAGFQRPVANAGDVLTLMSSLSATLAVIDKPANAGLKIAWQVLVFQQDAVLERLMPALDLALRLRMVWGAANESHVLGIQPLSQLSGDVAGTTIAEQMRLMDNPGLIATWPASRRNRLDRPSAVQGSWAAAPYNP